MQVSYIVPGKWQVFITTVNSLILCLIHFYISGSTQEQADRGLWENLHTE